MLYVKYSSRVQGKALFTDNPYKRGDIVHVLFGKELRTPTRLSIEIEPDLHVLDDWGIYMNHSSTPSVYIRGFHVVALRDIESGDEIHFDYNKNETKCCAPFYDYKSNIDVVGKMNLK
tara:strand:+ start:3950 stop:4303 length:354 start_codon:yes stop_codon:yes gene_type:complete